jgi:hypothetical protein
MVKISNVLEELAAFFFNPEEGSSKFSQNTGNFDIECFIHWLPTISALYDAQKTSY